MAHKRPGKTAKRNRRYVALDQLRFDLKRNERLIERRITAGADPTQEQLDQRLRIKNEIAALESRI